MPKKSSKDKNKKIEKKVAEKKASSFSSRQIGGGQKKELVKEPEVVSKPDLEPAPVKEEEVEVAKEVMPEEKLSVTEVSDEFKWKVSRLEDEKAHYNDRFNREILKHLEKLGLLDLTQVESILNYHETKQENIAQSVVGMGLLKPSEIGQAIADYFGATYVNLKNSKISSDVVRLIPEEVSKNEGVLAYQEDEKNIRMAMINPSDRHFIHLVEKKTGKKVIADYATPKDITDAQQIYRQDSLKGF